MFEWVGFSLGLPNATWELAGGSLSLFHLGEWGQAGVPPGPVTCSTVCLSGVGLGTSPTTTCLPAHLSACLPVWVAGLGVLGWGLHLHHLFHCPTLGMGWGASHLSCSFFLFLPTQPACLGSGSGRQCPPPGPPACLGPGWGSWLVGNVWGSVCLPVWLGRRGSRLAVIVWSGRFGNVKQNNAHLSPLGIPFTTSTLSVPARLALAGHWVSVVFTHTQVTPLSRRFNRPCLGRSVTG